MCVYTLSCSQFHLIKKISKMYTSNGLFLWLLKFWTQCNCMQIALTLKSLKNTKCIHYGYIFSWYIDSSTLQRQNKVGMDLQNYFSKFKNWICSQLFSNNIMNNEFKAVLKDIHWITYNQVSVYYWWNIHNLIFRKMWKSLYMLTTACHYCTLCSQYAKQWWLDRNCGNSKSGSSLNGWYALMFTKLMSYL